MVRTITKRNIDWFGTCSLINRTTIERSLCFCMVFLAAEGFPRLIIARAWRLFINILVRSYDDGGGGPCYPETTRNGVYIADPLCQPAEAQTTTNALAR